MKNLTNNYECDRDIRTELQSAGIIIVTSPERHHGEVPTTLTGKLTLSGIDVFTFTRGWCYWMVQGKVPLEVAEELFSTSTGKRDVRVGGVADNEDPKKSAFPTSEAIAAYMKENGLDSVNCGKIIKLCNAGKITAKRFVSSYHIDTQEGLELFVSTLRKYGLVD